MSSPIHITQYSDPPSLKTLFFLDCIDEVGQIDRPCSSHIVKVFTSLSESAHMSTPAISSNRNFL